MRKRPAILGIFLAIFAGILVSCESFQATREPPQVPTDAKTLRRVALPPDAVAFDVLLVSAPYEDRDLVRDFWKDVDELEVAPELRRALNEQGFRAGLLGASVPESLSRLLTLKGRELRTSLEEEIDFSKNEAVGTPTTRSKPVKLRTGMKSYIETRDDVIPSIPILEKEHGVLVGKSYSDARPIFSVSIEQIPDGSVRFDVTPFLRYGTPQSVGRYQHGQLVRVQEQPTKTFEALKCSVALRPGQFLAIGASDAKTNALGRSFFTDGGADYDQKILVIRLLVTQHDGQFNQFPDFKEIVRRENKKNENNGGQESGGDSGDSGDFDNSFDVEGFEASNAPSVSAQKLTSKPAKASDAEVQVQNAKDETPAKNARSNGAANATVFNDSNDFSNYVLDDDVISSSDSNDLDDKRTSNVAVDETLDE